MGKTGLISCAVSVWFVCATFSAYAQTGSVEWYCDKRWTEGRAILEGTVVKIEPVDSLPLDKRDKFKQLPNYSIANLLRVRMEKSYRNDFDRRYADKLNEILVPNLLTSSAKPKLFKVGEKFLFYLNAITELKDDLVTFYIDPTSQTGPVSETDDTIAFLEKVHKLDLLRDVLGYEGKDAVINGITSGKAVTLPKPVYPEDAKREKAGEAIRVYLLVDETGKVIKAKALCAQHADLARSAESAALNAKFSPILVSGKPVKVQGTITYNFNSQ